MGMSFVFLGSDWAVACGLATAKDCDRNLRALHLAQLRHAEHAIMAAQG
jgi:hypothetical protein